MAFFRASLGSAGPAQRPGPFASLTDSDRSLPTHALPLFSESTTALLSDACIVGIDSVLGVSRASPPRPAAVPKQQVALARPAEELDQRARVRW
jgi:hypothetical protein